MYRSWVSGIAYYPAATASEPNTEIINRSISHIDDGTGTVSIPDGVKTAYVLFSTGTSYSPRAPYIDGSIIRYQNKVAYATKVLSVAKDANNNDIYLRSCLTVIKLDLSGSAGTITTSTHGGAGSLYSWAASVIYSK